MHMILKIISGTKKDNHSSLSYCYHACESAVFMAWSEGVRVGQQSNPTTYDSPSKRTRIDSSNSNQRSNDVHILDNLTHGANVGTRSLLNRYDVKRRYFEEGGVVL